MRAVADMIEFIKDIFKIWLLAFVFIATSAVILFIAYWVFTIAVFGYMYFFAKIGC
jgi:hypothetical protein